MLEEPQWELVFEKARWIIEKYRLSNRYVLWFVIPYIGSRSLESEKAKTRLKIEY